MTFKGDRTTTHLTHLEPSAHEKNCVCGTCFFARGAVCCSHFPSLTRESLLLVSEILEKHIDCKCASVSQQKKGDPVTFEEVHYVE